MINQHKIEEESSSEVSRQAMVEMKKMSKSPKAIATRESKISFSQEYNKISNN